jgi:hypothetical protein
VVTKRRMDGTSKNRVRQILGQIAPRREARSQGAEAVPGRDHPLSELGWSREKAARVRASLRAFDEDWNAPGMEEYDRL